MSITQECLLAVLHANGIEEDYIDVHQIGSVTYYFGAITLKFTNGCVPFPIIRKYLSLFGLTHLVQQLQIDTCQCDW
jgi:hypothetical protein